MIRDPQTSPDGTRIAFVVRQMDEEKNDYVSNIYLVNRQGESRQFTSGDKDASPRWSPDGKWIAFVSGRKEKAQIHLIPSDGGESIALTERKFGAGLPVWSPDSTRIAFAGQVSTDPDEEKEDSKEKEKDPKKPAKTKIVERATFKLDGAGWIGNRRVHLFVVGTDKKLEQLTEGDHNNDNPAWSPDGEHIAFVSNREDCWDVSSEQDIYTIPSGGGQPRRLTTGRAAVNPVFSPDGSRIAFVDTPDHETNITPGRLVSMDRAGGDLRDEQGTWDGELGHEIISDVVHPDEGFGLQWREDGGLFFIGTERGVANVYRANGGKVESVTCGRHSLTDYSMAVDGTIACAIADATHPAEVYVWDGSHKPQVTTHKSKGAGRKSHIVRHRSNGEDRRGDGRAERLTHENDAFLEEVWIGEPERLIYSGARGEESEGWLLAPKGAESGKHPLIVYIHGGPMSSYGESLFLEYQYLAGQGFGVWYPNIHGSSTYGADYQLSIHADWGNLDYQDVMAGTDEAAKRDWVDSSRMAIIGGSYGGYMSSWVMGHTDRFKTGVVERCLCNIVNFFGTMDVGWMWNRQTGAYPEDDVEKIWDMSPLKYVKNVKGPVLVIHSEGDNRTPIEQGEQMFTALRRLGKEVKFIRFPEESHGLSRIGKPSRRVERMGYIAGWFKEKL
jgi:dipeptidyl aminopeptidase/acylaminoacyl peptidase